MSGGLGTDRRPTHSTVGSSASPPAPRCRTMARVRKLPHNTAATIITFPLSHSNASRTPGMPAKAISRLRYRLKPTADGTLDSTK
jgi:hypothetical protein